MIVPELPPEIRDLKERIGRFVEEEAYPLEERIAKRGSIDSAEVDALRRKSREAGFAMLNMDHGCTQGTRSFSKGPGAHGQSWAYLGHLVDTQKTRSTPLLAGSVHTGTARTPLLTPVAATCPADR